jgi:putative transferase (TIGR04331 family)
MNSDWAGKVLLLDDWCRQNIAEESSIDKTSVAFRWDKKNDYRKAVLRVIEDYENILVWFANALNKIHSVSFGLNYWRILVGPWLYRFLSWAYDKYVHIEKAAAQFNGRLHTRVLHSDDFMVPFDTDTFRDFAENKFYNYQLLSDIVKYMRIDAEEDASKAIFLNRYYAMCMKSMRRGVQENMPSILQRIATSDICVFVSQQLNIDQEIIDGRRVYCRCLDMPWPGAFELRCRDRTLTDTLDRSERNFLDFMQHVILRYTPSIFLESYPVLQKITRDIGRFPALFFSDNWHQNELIKLVAAMVSESGGKIITVNAGDMAGILQYEFVERHEKQISDRMLGRSTQLYEECLWPDRRVVFPCSEGPKKTLYLSSGFHLPYISDFSLFPSGVFQCSLYFESQLAFFRELNRAEKEKILYRPHPYRNDMGYSMRVRKMGINVSESVHLLNDIKQADLVIIDHITTAIYTVLKADVPFLCCFEQSDWALTNEAATLFQMMREVGLFYNCLKSVLVFLRQPDDVITRWWNSERTTIVRRNLKRLFYSESDVPEKDIRGTIQKISMES